ncbi:hypothetical protein [Komagataeibacter intermedius]|uniref:Uncharacterized protein n=1 Tax=Komagataeibacter intermedius NRIC 0521 TaxID=1307934 RepID=A0ABQ0PNG3_9PROT|nr:hypothetical protein [Komagataeibacter intermedius]GAN86235.1 hypothetical protein Gain_0024_002 [Komagataeibacter intermedius TF2]GBQ76618.1 hypothetical protein AA0521_2922 [Komagataeibacter intermedius NRIC 0521]
MTYALPNDYFEKVANQLSIARPLTGRIAEMGGRTFVGTKIIHATPMNRREYNTLRGWELPADENGDDAGYLVQYADQDHTNLPGFTGYISWSPADVFNAAYAPVTEDGNA